MRSNGYFFECEVDDDCKKTFVNCKECPVYLSCKACFYRHECDNFEKCFFKCFPDFPSKERNN